MNVVTANQTPEAFAVWLLGEHERLFSADDRNRNFAFRFRSDDPPTRALIHELERLIPPHRRVAPPLIAARDWWSESANDDDLHARFRRAHTLLRHLDQFYSSQQPTSLRVGNDQLFLGRRWWNARARAGARGVGPLDGLRFSVAPHFAHVRVVRGAHPGTWVVHPKPATFYAAIEERMLRIGLCALDGNAVTVFEPSKVVTSDGPTLGFVATGMTVRARKTGEHYEAELREAMKTARKRNVHVLCFPELSVCAKGRAVIREELERNPGTLALVVGGSFHDDIGGGDRQNAAPYWTVDDSGAAEELGAFVKTQAFSTSVDAADQLSHMKATCAVARTESCAMVVEDIQLSNVAHIVQTPVGVFGIAICKDQIGARAFVERYEAVIDHLLVVSMNAAAAGWFFPASEEPARRSAVATFYVNCTQIVEDPSDEDVDMAFWHMPAVRGKKTGRFFRAGKETKLRRVLPEDGFVDIDVDIPEVLASPWGH